MYYPKIILECTTRRSVAVRIGRIVVVSVTGRVEVAIGNIIVIAPLIGLMRKRFILILINMTINGDEKSKVDYDNMIEEMSKNLIPVRPDRKNPRNKYKGYNKYRQNYKRNS